MASPNIIAGDVLLTTLQGTLFGQRTITTFHWSVNAMPVATSLLSLLTLLEANLMPDFKGMLSNEWSASEVTGRRIIVNATRSYSVQSVGNGSVASSSLPPSVAGVISRFTNASGKKGRGRIYVPAVPDLWHLNGQLSQAGLNAYDLFRPRLDLPTTLAGGIALEPVLFTRPNTVVFVEGSLVRNILRSQRRREIGVGI